jgi:Lrp/AsnC family transcriptional regulator, leucine-responsive regulatory protein
MDDIDRKILDHVQLQGRASYAEIGAAVGLSVSAINDRLKKLQELGVIRGWGARVDPRAVGRGVLALMFVSLDRPEAERRFLEAATALPDVLECHHVTGDWNYLLKLRLSDIADLETVLADTIKAQPGVVRTHTMIVLSSPKETAIIPCFGRTEEKP